ncbi:MAG: hypothetical protein A3G21_09355 [Acidobacteria bacterium RIFCSPLOWO2_12_FULL_66_21]|nr:MAG: hypothetical protein A3G21_09355 [Acidobacteria bacterium RIFCSPLOWO2_12_FULL_66_21]
MNFGFRQAAMRTRVGQAVLAGKASHLLEGDVPPGVPFEHLSHQWAADWVDLDPARLGIIQVTHVRHCGPVALLGLFAHALPNFFGEVVDVVLGHQDPDPVHELLGRPRIVRQDHAFLDQVDLEIEVAYRHPVLDVPVQAVCLFDEEHWPRCGILLEEGNHLAEGRAPGTLGSFDVLELPNDLQSVLYRVFSEQLPLGRDREALLLLLLRRHPHVEHGFPHGRGHGVRLFGGPLFHGQLR